MNLHRILEVESSVYTNPGAPILSLCLLLHVFSSLPLIQVNKSPRPWHLVTFILQKWESWTTFQKKTEVPHLPMLLKIYLYI